MGKNRLPWNRDLCTPFGTVRHSSRFSIIFIRQHIDSMNVNYNIYVALIYDIPAHYYKMFSMPFLLICFSYLLALPSLPHILHHSKIKRDSQTARGSARAISVASCHLSKQIIICCQFVCMYACSLNNKFKQTQDTNMASKLQFSR